MKKGLYLLGLMIFLGSCSGYISKKRIKKDGLEKIKRIAVLSLVTEKDLGVRRAITQRLYMRNRWTFNQLFVTKCMGYCRGYTSKKVAIINPIVLENNKYFNLLKEKSGSIRKYISYGNYPNPAEVRDNPILVKNICSQVSLDGVLLVEVKFSDASPFLVVGVRMQLLNSQGQLIYQDYSNVGEKIRVSLFKSIMDIENYRNNPKFDIRRYSRFIPSVTSSIDRSLKIAMKHLWKRLLSNVNSSM